MAFPSSLPEKSMKKPQQKKLYLILGCGYPIKKVGSWMVLSVTQRNSAIMKRDGWMMSQ
jgi:hypothetical protein